jgi:hypothetical protein
MQHRQLASSFGVALAGVVTAVWTLAVSVADKSWVLLLVSFKSLDAEAIVKHHTTRHLIKLPSNLNAERAPRPKCEGQH